MIKKNKKTTMKHQIIILVQNWMLDPTNLKAFFNNFFFVLILKIIKRRIHCYTHRREVVYRLWEGKRSEATTPHAWWEICLWTRMILLIGVCC